MRKLDPDDPARDDLTIELEVAGLSDEIEAALLGEIDINTEEGDASIAQKFAKVHEHCRMMAIRLMIKFNLL